MHRRAFVRLLAAAASAKATASLDVAAKERGLAPLALAFQIRTGLPPLKVVSRYAPLAVPGMPAGSPGMEGASAQRYQVLTFDKSGKTTVFASH